MRDFGHACPFQESPFPAEPAADLGHRALLWTLGQTPMTSVLISPLSIKTGYKCTQAESLGQFAAKIAELNDIASYIMLSQAQTRNILKIVWACGNRSARLLM